METNVRAASDPAVQVNSRDDRFERVHQQGFLGTAAAHLLAASEIEETAEIDPPRHAVQMGGTHQVSLLARELAFGRFGEAPHQGLRDQKAQDGIAQELQLFVIVLRFGTGTGFVGQGTVGERAEQQLRVGEAMIEPQLQGCQLRAHVRKNYFPPLAAVAAFFTCVATALICG